MGEFDRRAEDGRIEPNRRTRRALRRRLGLNRDTAKSLWLKVIQRERMTAILLMIPAAATTALTFSGVSVPLEEQGGGIVSKGQALAFAVTIGVFSWLGWYYLFGLIYKLRGRRLTASLCAGTFYIAMVAAIDAPFNMIALAGGLAVQMSIADASEYFEERSTAVARDATFAQQLLPAIEAQAGRFQDGGQNEEDFGIFSGGGGPGKVSASFFQIAKLLEGLSVALREGLAEAEAVQDEITESLAAIKTEVYTTGPLRPRVRRVAILADDLEAQLGRLARFDYAVSIEATLASLKSIVPKPEIAASEFERRQNAELGAIAAMAKPVAEDLQAALETLRASKTATPERVRPEHALTAIRTYWKPLIFQWVAAIFIDVAPAALLVLLTAAFREVDAREAEDARDPHSDTDKEA